MGVSVFRNILVAAGKTEYVASAGEKVNCFGANDNFLIKLGNTAFSYMEKGLVMGDGKVFTGFSVRNPHAFDLLLSFAVIADGASFEDNRLNLSGSISAEIPAGVNVNNWPSVQDVSIKNNYVPKNAERFQWYMINGTPTTMHQQLLDPNLNTNGAIIHSIYLQHEFNSGVLAVYDDTAAQSNVGNTAPENMIIGGLAYNSSDAVALSLQKSVEIGPGKGLFAYLNNLRTFNLLGCVELLQ